MEVQLDYVVVCNAEETYMRSCGMSKQPLDTPIHFKEYDTPDTARNIFSKLQNCKPCFMPKIYPLFSSNNSSCGCLATVKRGVSLHSYLQQETNKRRLIDFYQNQPYQASDIYKKIIQSLMIIVRSLAGETLKCSFDLKHIFMFQTGDDVRIEVLDIDLLVPEIDEIWTDFANCLDVINNILSSLQYSTDRDVTMRKVQEHLRAATNVQKNLEVGSDQKKVINFIDTMLLNSTFFWNWYMKKNFISRVKQLGECGGNLWRRHCYECFEGWEAKVDKDPDLKKFRLQYEISANTRKTKSSGPLLQPSSQQPPPQPLPQQPLVKPPPQPLPQQPLVKPPKACVSFIRGSFEHFFESRNKIQVLNIRDMKELQVLYDCVFGDYSGSFIKEAKYLATWNSELDFSPFIDSLNL